jgi:hypothetical protein
MCEINVDIMKLCVTLINSMSKGSVPSRRSFPMIGQNWLLELLPTFVTSQPTNKPSSQRWDINFAFTELREATIASSMLKQWYQLGLTAIKSTFPGVATQKCFVRFRQDLLPPSHYLRPTQQRVKEKVCNKPFECKHYRELVIAIYILNFCIEIAKKSEPGPSKSSLLPLKPAGLQKSWVSCVLFRSVTLFFK